MSVVLDASALLAYLLDEPGADRVSEALAEPAAISAVNYAETLAKLAEDGESADELAARFEAEGLVGGVLGVEAVLPEDAPTIARLRSRTAHLGLSLADRSCLALAARLELPIITADRAWAELEVGVQVETIR